jgi:hypothetical protein
VEFLCFYFPLKFSPNSILTTNEHIIISIRAFYLPVFFLKAEDWNAQNYSFICGSTLVFNQFFPVKDEYRLRVSEETLLRSIVENKIDREIEKKRLKLNKDEFINIF